MLYDCFLTNYKVRSGKGKNEKGHSWIVSAGCKNQLLAPEGSKEKGVSISENMLCQPEAQANTGDIKVNVSGFCNFQVLIWYVYTNGLHSH